MIAEHRGVAAALFLDRDIEEVHLRGADEARDKDVARLVVEVLRGVHLLDEAVLHDDDPVAHRHRLGLVVGDVDEGGAQALVQLGDLRAHRGAQLGVEVGERLVEQEDRRVADHRAPERDALPLSARKRLGLAVEQVLDVEHLGRLMHLAVDLLLGGLAQLKAERHILIDGHVRVERVVLEDHRDVAVLGGHVVDQLVADVELALADLLEPRDHAQGGGFAATGRADEDDELLVVDLEVEIAHGGHVAGIDLEDVAEGNACHNIAPYSKMLILYHGYVILWISPIILIISGILSNTMVVY